MAIKDDDEELNEIETGVVTPEPLTDNCTYRQLPSFLWAELFQ